ncbi:MAG: low-specificity L-threonine aldolase [Firmicutes bacterium]|nr:low-specificity L-threonine aldolase [Bacillota bacterium]MCL5040336.1 low-specificity L-threonine aldolase [Bacillota bacterium]
MKRFIDLRSDTVTSPTNEMREAMAAAEVGDDVYGEDPTIRQLEELAAEKVGKEAAVFVPTGTMGNQIAVLTHTQRGDEVIVEAEAHIYFYEVAGLAALSSVQARPVKGSRGVLDPDDVAAATRPANIHFPRSALLCIENTHNRAGGTVTPVQRMWELARVAHEYGLAVHLDGARVFNAALALGVDVKELTAPVDSVMFCLSKGLSAPVGSLVAGTKEWVARARKYRKLLGGGMRQAGVLAAAGIVALEKMVNRLAEDHANAHLLGGGLAQIPGIKLDLATVQTNMVTFELDKPGLDGAGFVRELLARGVKANATGPKRIRFVTHKDVSREDILTALQVVQAIMRG